MKTTKFQDQVIERAIDTYIESEELLQQSQSNNDGVATDYLQAKLQSIVDRLNYHFQIPRNQILELITKTKTTNETN